MIKDRNIIVHGLQSLDSPIGSNCINIAYEFSKQNKVLYVNYALDRITSIKQKANPLIIKRKNILRNKQPDLIQINENMWNLYPRTILESINQIGFKPLVSSLNKINNKRFAAKIKEAIDKLGFKDFILFNDSDFYRGLHLSELLYPALSVYYTRDNMRATHYFRKHGTFYEDKIMKKSDLIVSNSVYLNNIAKEQNPNSIYVGQGCDISLFDGDLIEEIPEDIKKIKNPIIGYIGALKSSRLSIETIEFIAKSKPEWNIVLVGPEDDLFKTSSLHNYSNIHLLGSKKMEELPSYLKAFTIAINPQSLNPLTIGNYPRKIDEYLAMGKPTVATLTETMKVFKNYTYLAETNEDYVKLIDLAIKENSKEKEQNRKDFAKTHTWENNVSEIYKAFEKALNNR